MTCMQLESVNAVYSMFHSLCIFYGLLQMDGQSVVKIMPIENEQVVDNRSIIDTTHSMAYSVPNRGIPLETT